MGTSGAGHRQRPRQPGPYRQPSAASRGTPKTSNLPFGFKRKAKNPSKTDASDQRQVAPWGQMVLRSAGFARERNFQLHLESHAGFSKSILS